MKICYTEKVDIVGPNARLPMGDPSMGWPTTGQAPPFVPIKVNVALKLHQESNIIGKRLFNNTSVEWKNELSVTSRLGTWIFAKYCIFVLLFRKHNLFLSHHW